MDILTIALLGLAWKAFKTKKTSAKLEYYPQALKIDEKKKVATLVMEIVNPTQTAIKVDNIFGSLFINDKSIARVEVTKPFTIEKAKTTRIGIPIKEIGGTAVVSIATAVLQGKKVVAKFAGTVRALGMDNPVSEEIPLSL